MQFGEEMRGTSHGGIQGDTLFRLPKVYRRRTGRLGIRRRRRSTLYSKSWSTSGGSFSTGTLSHRSETISEHVHVSCVVGLEVNLRGRECIATDWL